MSVYENLSTIQKALKAPKNQFNAFGKYNYRNCEDILEAVKPLLNGSTLYIFDTIELVGDRYYVKATVVFRTGDDMVTVTAYAREELDKKGMDSSQITGAASSYARKYALNGLFLIDDTKDADTKDNTKKPDEPKKPQTETLKDKLKAKEDITEEAKLFQDKCLELGMSTDEITQFKKHLFRRAPTKAELMHVITKFTDLFDEFISMQTTGTEG